MRTTNKRVEIRNFYILYIKVNNFDKHIPYRNGPRVKEYVIS